MAEITKFPVEKVYPEIVNAREVWAQPEPPQEMVWAVCPHVRLHEEDSRCHQCPPWEDEPDHGKMRRGCYGRGGNLQNCFCDAGARSAAAAQAAAIQDERRNYSQA